MYNIIELVIGERKVLMRKFFKGKKIYKIIIILAILVYFVYILFSQQKTLNSYKTEQEYISEQIQEQEEYKEKLANMQDNIDWDEFIEQIARDKLNMYLPNERVYVDANK